MAEKKRYLFGSNATLVRLYTSQYRIADVFGSKENGRKCLDTQNKWLAITDIYMYQ